MYEMTPNRLVTLHEQYHRPTARWLREAGAYLGKRAKSVKLIFDSGAFTLWNQSGGDKQLSVDDLIETYHKFETGARRCGFETIYFISLDVIPGKVGVTPTREQIADAVERSDDNHIQLAKHFGNRVLPVFHQGESVERLREVCVHNPEYVCISPRNDVATVHRISWSMRTHEVMQAEGLTTRTHCLGTTSSEFLARVPWSSTDSSTWIQAAISGGIKLLSGEDIKDMQVSEHSPQRRNWRRHATTAGPDVAALIDAQLADMAEVCTLKGLKYGGEPLAPHVTFENLMKEPTLRMAMNLRAFARLDDVVEYKPQPIPATLFEL